MPWKETTPVDQRMHFVAALSTCRWTMSELSSPPTAESLRGAGLQAEGRRGGERRSLLTRASPLAAPPAEDGSHQARSAHHQAWPGW